MQTIETEIEIDQDLLLQVEKFANATGASRDQVFAVALTEFIQHHKNNQVSQQENDRNELSTG